MFTETLAVTIAGATVTLVRVNQDNYCSEYLFRDANQQMVLNIRNSRFTDKKRPGAELHRHALELVTTIFPVAPATVPTVRKAYWVLENEASDGVTAPKDFGVGFAALLTAANMTKLLNFES
jgi:hypothetical protein